MQGSFKALRLKQGLSERECAVQAGISRMTLRHLELGDGNCTLGNFSLLCSVFHRELVVLALPEAECLSHSSSIAVSLKVVRDGFESWPIHVMELVDDFRKTLDSRLLLLPPDPSSDKKMVALLSSIVLMLCEETDLEFPRWAERCYWLEDPWFVSGVESLKAMAILESPWAFRRNNIFVLDNFLKRA